MTPCSRRCITRPSYSTEEASLMEAHAAPAAAKRMWTYLRAVFFMARKGVLANKRKLFVSMHLLMKRRNRAVARTVANLLSLSHHHHGHGGNALRRRDYEFSCSNSPDPGSWSFSGRQCRHAYFPCLLGAVTEEEEGLASPTPPFARIEHYAASPAPSSSPGLLTRELAPGDFSVRVSNYSSEDEGAGSAAVDDEAEEFIQRFYEQLRRQNHLAMLPYMQASAA